MGNLKQLWAPWRRQFLAQRPTRQCIFCVAKRSRHDRRHHVIVRGTQVFALLNRYPYNSGHLMIAPYRHIGNLASLSVREWTDILHVGQQLTRQLTDTLHPHGFNVGFNLGRVAGAGIPGHLHVHIVPRWNGDTNFMPVLAGTKVLPQSLDELYTMLTSQPVKGSR